MPEPNPKPSSTAAVKAGRPTKPRSRIIVLRHNTPTRPISWRANIKRNKPLLRPRQLPPLRRNADSDWSEPRVVRAGRTDGAFCGRFGFLGCCLSFAVVA